MDTPSTATTVPIKSKNVIDTGMAKRTVLVRTVVNPIMKDGHMLTLSLKISEEKMDS